MKKIISLILVLALVLTFAACKKKTDPVETTPPTEITEEYSKPVDKPEVTPDMDEIATMPPVIPNDVSGDELATMYANFLKTYDWSQYNGFTSEASNSVFTYCFTGNSAIYDTKLMSAYYDGAIEARLVDFWEGTTQASFAMTDAGSFGTSHKQNNEASFHPVWRLINDTSITHYDHTEVKNNIYDVIYFATTYQAPPASPNPDTIYVVCDNETEEVFTIGYIDGGWECSATWAMNYATTDIQFDVETVTVTLPDKTIHGVLLAANTENQTTSQENTFPQDITIEGYMYVNRQTKKVEYMEDKVSGTVVTFLSNATPDFTMPDNVRDGVPEDIYIINDIHARFVADVARYFE